MKAIKLIGVLIITILIQICFLPLRLVIGVINIIQSILSVLKAVIRCLMSEIRYEVLEKDHSNGQAQKRNAQSEAQVNEINGGENTPS